jgi:transcriptional regulator with XRE-family HTH domain
MTVSDVVAARVRQIRKRRDWSPADLAERCAALGAADLTENVIENIESRSARASKRPRPVTVDELLALGAALNVAPVHLLIPIDDVAEPYGVTSAVSEQAAYVRQWIRGELPLGDADPREFYAETERAAYYDTPFGRAVAARQAAVRHGEEDSSGKR